MAQLIDQLVNGHRYAFTSIVATILTPMPRIVTQITAINYETSRDIGILRGTSAKKLGRTRGEFDFTGSMTLYKEEFDRLVTELKKAPFPPGAGFGEKVFQITVQYGEAPPSIPSLDTLVGATITRISQNNSQGPDALMVDLDLDYMDILYNGSSPVVDRGGI
jgi:hypothetical protein